jgi:uncharacterized protein YjiS (DUF1127 family)
MTDVVVHSPRPFGAALRVKQFVALVSRSFRRVIMTHAARRALNDLPDNVLEDIGLTRGEIPFVADAIADEEANRDTVGRHVRTALECGPAARFLPRVFF